MVRNIASYTKADSSYPEFISVNQKDDHTVSISIRPTAKVDSAGVVRESEISEIIMSNKDYAILALNMVDHEVVKNVDTIL